MAFLVVIVSVFYIAIVVVWVSQVFSKMDDQEVKVEHQSPPPGYDFSVEPSVFQDLKEVASLIESGAYISEVRKIYRAMRLTMKLRSKLKASVLSTFLNYALAPASEVRAQLSSYLPQDRHDTQVDVVMPVTESKHLLPELKIFCYLLFLIFLIDQKKYNEAKACSTESIAHLKSMRSITADVLASKLYFYYSLSYELAGDLADIRGNLLALYRSATVHHNKSSQETLLNLLLRNYLHYNLYDQAEKFRSKAHQVEPLSNQQCCRYFFYQGKIKTIQLEYTDAKDCLLQAANKGPTTAVGFQIQCNKWAVIAHLLLGEIPERTIFTQKRMEKALRPYFELTNAFRVGDLELFRRVAEKFCSTFRQDRTCNLIIRLKHNVIRTGLRNISVSYTRISLADIAKKLNLNFENVVDDAENIVAKAIRDGAIDATLDHANGWLVSKATGDVYSTNEPQFAFDLRIAFCLNMHNEALRALRFPQDLRDKESVAA